MASELGVQTIQHTNGTDALTIGSTGVITTQQAMYPKGLTYWPAFIATGDSNAWATGQSADTLLPFDTVTSGNAYDNGNDFDTTNKRYVAPISGLYSMSFCIYAAATSSSNGFLFRINGTKLTGYNSLKFHTYSDGSDDNTQSMTLPLNLNAGDYVDIVCSVNGTDFYIGHSTFSGYYIGG
jgi:hypothetical protein